LPLFFFSICVVIAVSSKSPSAFVGWRSPRSFSYRVVCVYVVCVVGFFFFSGIQNAHHRPRRLLPLSLDGRHEQILSAKRGYNGTAVVQSGSSATNQKSVRQRGQKSTLGLKSLTRASMEEAEEVELDAMERMEKAMEVMSDNFATVRTGRANPNMLDRIEVDYYGAMTPLKSLSNTNNLDAQTLVIQPFDKGALKEIEKAIVRSDLGITPSNDGSVIRLVVPPLTAERRKELTKQVSKLGEEGKVALRNVRRDAMTKIKKMKTDKTLGEDEVASFEKKIEELTSSYVKKTDDAVKAKEKELTTV
jgi:ribosome recycling factor